MSLRLFFFFFAMVWTETSKSYVIFLWEGKHVFMKGGETCSDIKIFLFSENWLQPQNMDDVRVS